MLGALVNLHASGLGTTPSSGHHDANEWPLFVLVVMLIRQPQ